MRRAWTLGGAFLTGAAVALALGALAGRRGPVPAPETAPGAMAAPAEAAPAAASGGGGAATDPLRWTPVVRAVQKVAPTVVSITTEVPVDDPFALLLGVPRTSTSEGSGVVIAPDGTVLTNAHVVQGAARIVATFADGASYEAEILGTSPELDLAVLHLRGARGLPAVEIGSSDDLLLGETVIAIGNPFGLGHTVTTGVVSALHRELETDERVYQDFIQTDASINPGNSGGPLLDIHGRLVGINTAIRANAENIGFAIPVDRAMKVARDLLQYGRVQIAWIGVELEDVWLRTAGGAQTAARVVRAGRAAREAGLRRGDVIVEVDGRPVQGRADLNAYLASFDPPREVVLGVVRGDTRLEVRVRAVRLPEDEVDRTIREVLGIEVAALADVVPQAKGGGVVVVRADRAGTFARSGLRAGDVVLAVNGRVVRTVEDFREAIGMARSGHWSTVLLTVRRGTALGRVAVPI